MLGCCIETTHMAPKPQPSKLEVQAVHGDHMLSPIRNTHNKPPPGSILTPTKQATTASQNRHKTGWKAHTLPLTNLKINIHTLLTPPQQPSNKTYGQTPLTTLHT